MYDDPVIRALTILDITTQANAAMEAGEWMKALDLFTQAGFTPTQELLDNAAIEAALSNPALVEPRFVWKGNRAVLFTKPLSKVRNR